MGQNHFFLPELEANIPVPKENAHWFNNERKIILGISNGIIIDEKAMTTGVSSIPDIWARPLLFQSAIRSNSKHPLYKKCTQEWRGLISILALHKIKQELSDLEIVAVTLDNETFSTALKNLAPSPIQLEKEVAYSWTNVLMIRFNNIPIGAFSPATLVYTAVDYRHELNKLKENKPSSFMDKDGYLAPPLTKDGGLEFLGEWLYSFQQKLKPILYGDQQNQDHQTVGTINDLIDEWLKEIRSTLGLSENDPIDIRTHKVAEEPIDIKGIAPYLKEYKVFERLLHPLKKDESAKNTILISDILLQSSRNKDKKIVVITEKALSSQINIWNERRPNSLGSNAKTIIETFFNKDSGTLIGNEDIGKEGGLWIRPERYFLSEKLIKAKEGAILSETEKEWNIDEKFILPFKREILDFFSPLEIKEKLKPVYRSDGNTVKFWFTLPVGNTFYKIEKTYTPKATHVEEGEIVEIEVPVVEIFPNYLDENWRRYYLFQGKAESFFANPLSELKQVDVEYREREFIDTNPQKIRVYKIAGTKSFPEAIELTNETAAALGLILIQKKVDLQGLKNKWTIGIDFGTSNTNVFSRRGEEDNAQAWTYNFPDYYRSITQSNLDIRKRILREYFFPTDQVNLPIPSTLKIYNLARKDSMVLDYFIYYPIHFKFPENVLSDIKWDTAGERKTEYFLESLLFLLLIEVVKNNVEEVHLACSYPKAFSETNIEVFKREWEAVFNKLLKPDKNNSQHILDIHSGAADNETKIKIKIPKYRTEGIAAGEYFASELTIKRIEERANKEIAAICLDVGGGTTDISIWYLNNIEFDASVLLAGRQLANLLQINSRVRDLLFSKNAAIALEEKKNESSYFSARLNLVLKTEEERIQEMLVKYANNKDIQWLRQIIALEFGALAFYAAQVCVSTNEKVGGLLSRIADDGINLHWGGNAAKLINWIDFGKYNSDGIASKILNGTFFNCLNDKELAQRAVRPKALMQLQSPGHKSEASGGLVVMELEHENSIISTLSSDSDMRYDMPEEGSADQKFYAGIVCGENIRLTDRDIAFFVPITNKDLFDNDNNTKFKSTTLDRLIRFVDVLNFFGIKFGLFTEDTKIILGENEKRIIRDGVLKEFIKMQRQSESQRLIEPIFITEIKLLLEIIKSKLN